MANNFIQKIAAWVDWGLSIYEGIMKATLRIPFTRIDRGVFLRSALKRLPSELVERALESTPREVVEKGLLETIAKREVRKNILLATLVSFVTAIPTNWTMWPCILFDLLFFQVQVFLISQKMLFLYGDGKEAMELQSAGRKENADRLMLVVSTIMIGKQKVSRAAKTVAGMVGRQLVERFGSRLLSKIIIFNTLRQIAKWAGISFTKAMLLETITLLIPIICASISALVSYILIAPMAKKLHLHLKCRMEGADLPPSE